MLITPFVDIFVFHYESLVFMPEFRLIDPLSVCRKLSPSHLVPETFKICLNLFTKTDKNCQLFV